MEPPSPPTTPPTTAAAHRAPHRSQRRRRGRTGSAPFERVDPDIAVLRRRHVYRAKMRCLHVGSNRISRFKDFTPRMVAEDEELKSRAKMFVRRELQVFEWTNENAEFILEYIVAVLQTAHLKSATGAAQDMLADFLGRENAGIFCHEVHAFLRSPFTSLAAFDGFVQYERPLPTRFDGEGLPIVVPEERPAGSRADRTRRRPVHGGGDGAEIRRRSRAG